MSLNYDVIVVGAGVMGISSALYCQKKGLKTLLLDQFSFPHIRGSSHGGTRITRRAYKESTEISKMMAEGNNLWRELEAETGQRLKLTNGTLIVEEAPSNKLREIAAVNDRLGYEYSWLNSDEIRQRYKGALSFNGYNAILDHDGGALMADKCLKTMMKSFQSKGGTFQEMSPVVDFNVSKGSVQVTLSSGSKHHSRHLVLSAGAWASELLEKLDLHLPLKPEAVTVPFWAVKQSSIYDINKFPCLQDVTNKHWGIPPMEYHGLFKLVDPKTNEVMTNPNIRDAVSTPRDQLMGIYRPYITEHFPNLAFPAAIIERCLYTVTPDGLWIVDQHPVHNNVIVLAGFSGHGFKAGPMIGKLVSEMVMGSSKIERYDMSTLSIDRFKKQSISHL